MRDARTRNKVCVKSQSHVIIITFLYRLPEETLTRRLGFPDLHRSTSFRSIRVVVQHTRQPEGWFYRLIAYEDTRTYRPVNFAAINDIVRAIRLVAPDFAVSNLAINEDADRSYIAFRADWELNDGQLFLLGLDLVP